MLRAARKLGVPVAASGVVLPMAVAIFRATGPAMNLAVAIYIAYWFGIELTPTMLAIGVAAAATTTIGAAGIPGQASFFTSIAPICLAMGVPIEPLALLIAVETLPGHHPHPRQCQHGRRGHDGRDQASGFTDAPETEEDELLMRGV